MRAFPTRDHRAPQGLRCSGPSTVRPTFVVLVTGLQARRPGGSSRLLLILWSLRVRVTARLASVCAAGYRRRRRRARSTSPPPLLPGVSAGNRLGSPRPCLLFAHSSITLLWRCKYRSVATAAGCSGVPSVDRRRRDSRRRRRRSPSPPHRVTPPPFACARAAVGCYDGYDCAPLGEARRNPLRCAGGGPLAGRLPPPPLQGRHARVRAASAPHKGERRAPPLRCNLPGSFRPTGS